MAKNREFPGEYQSGSSWHETNIPLDSRLFSALPLSLIHIYAGHILISDTVKPHAKQAIKELKKCGVKKTIMLTGDRKNVEMCIRDSHPGSSVRGKASGWPG